MGGGSESSSRHGLHPGDQFDCKLCGQRSVAALHSGILECSQCLFQIQEYDTVMHDRVPLDDEGRISGRGPVQRPGGIQGSVISSKGDSASSRRWKRLSLIDRRGGEGSDPIKTPDDRTHQEARCDNHPPSDSLGSPRVRLARFRFRRFLHRVRESNVEASPPSRSPFLGCSMPASGCVRVGI